MTDTAKQAFLNKGKKKPSKNSSKNMRLNTFLIRKKLSIPIKMHEEPVKRLKKQKMLQPLSERKPLKIQDTDKENDVQDTADNEDKGTDNVNACALFLNIALSRSVVFSFGRFTDTSQRHLFSPLA